MKMKNWVALLLVVCLFAALPAFAAAAKTSAALKAAVVQGAVALSAPRADASVVAPLQGEVQVRELGLAFAKIKVNGTDAYVLTSQLQIENAVGFAIVTAPGGQLTLRKKSTTKATSLGKVKNGAVVVVTEKGETFTKVRYGSKEGYLLTKHLTESETLPGQGTMKVQWPEDAKRTRNIKYRWEAKTGKNEMGTIKTGTVVVVLGTEGDYTRIEYQGKIGYILTKYLAQDETTPAAGQGAMLFPSTSAFPAAPAFPAAGQGAAPAFPATPQTPAAPQGGTGFGFPQASQAPKATPVPTQEPGEYLNPDQLEVVDEGE